MRITRATTKKSGGPLKKTLEWEPVHCSENSWDIRLPSFSLSPLFFLSVSLSLSLSLPLSPRSCYTTLKGLVDCDELQCPTWSTLLPRLSSASAGCGLALAWALASRSVFYTLSYAYLCVIVFVYASVCAKHRPHACHSYQGVPFGLWQGRNVTADQHLGTQINITVCSNSVL